MGKTNTEEFLEVLKATPENLETLSNPELMSIYSKARKLATTTSDREGLYNAYRFILAEFKRRDLTPPKPAEKLWIDEPVLKKSEEEMAEVIGITAQELSKISDSDLVTKHWRAHQLSGQKQTDREYLQNLWSSHRRIIREMERRNKARGKEAFKHGEVNWLDKPFENKELAEDLAPVLPSGEELGKNIKMTEVLKHLKSFYIRDPLVLLTGGIANQGETLNDIEFLVRADDDELIYTPILFRIFRMFPPELANRIHFLDDEMMGAFTNYVPVFRLKVEVLEEFELKEMQEEMKGRAQAQANTSKRQNRIELFRHFFPLKGIEGYREGERYTIEAAASFFKEGDFPVVVQKKFDGARNFIHKSGDKIEIISEQGVNVTSRFPKIVGEIKGWKSPKQTILDAEFERWDGKKHLGREWMAGYQNAKTPPDDSQVVANVFDCLFFHDSGTKSNLNLQVGDLHKVDQTTRLQYLDLSPFKQSTFEIPKPGLNRSPSIIAQDPRALIGAIKKTAKLLASEGAMIKPGNLAYPLTGMTSRIIKFKNMAEVHCIIEKGIPTKTRGVYNYELALRIPPGIKVDPKSIRTIKGKDYTYVGRSYNTKTKASPGQIATISFHTLNVYRNPKTGTVRLHLYEPRWYELRPNQTVPDSVTEAIQIAKEAGLLGEKVEAAELDIFSFEEEFEREDLLAGTPWDWRLDELDPDKYAQWFDENSEFMFPSLYTDFQADPLMEIPSEDRKHSFVFQWHFRGKSVHTDFRMDIGRYLVGWTIMDGQAGKIKEPVITLSQARTSLRDFDNVSKLNNDPGMRNVKVVATPKARQPKIWFTLQGKTEKPETGEKAPIGGTKKFPGVFVIYDKGRVEFGAQKTWFHEYWLHGRKFNGKWVARYLPNIWKKGVPGREGEPEMLWMVWKAKDEEPYVLRQATVKEGWMPPLGISALPEHIRNRIPKEYQYWKAKSTKEAKEKRDSLRIAIRKKELKIFADEVPYTLQHQFFKGQTVVRAGATSFFWRINFDFPQAQSWMIYGNPLEDNSMTALKKSIPKDLITKEGELKPGSPLNPTKATPSFLRILDKGKALFLENRGDFKKIKFSGGKLKGMWVLRQETPGEPVWLFERAKLPEVSSEDLSLLDRNDLIEILERSEIYAGD